MFQKEKPPQLGPEWRPWESAPQLTIGGMGETSVAEKPWDLGVLHRATQVTPTTIG